MVFHYYTIILISDWQYLSFFWRYISFFRYFFIILIYNFFWSLLQWTYWDLRNLISNFITNQITSCFYCFLNFSLWHSFKCICSGLFCMIKNFFLLHLALNFLRILLPILLPIILTKQKKSIALYKYSITRWNWLNYFKL